MRRRPVLEALSAVVRAASSSGMGLGLLERVAQSLAAATASFSVLLDPRWEADGEAAMMVVMLGGEGIGHVNVARLRPDVACYMWDMLLF